MNKETAQWYLEIVDAFLKDPRLSEWNYLPRDYFLAHLKEIFKEIQEIETFVQAREILQKIINEEILAPSIPEKDSLEQWKQELEKAKVERRKIKEESIRLVQIQVKRWEEQRKVVIPLVEAVKAEAAKKVPLETEEEKLAKSELSLAQKIQSCLEDQDKSLTSDPDLSQTLAEEVKEIIVSEILFDPDKGIENLSLQIDRKFQERGVALGQAKIKNFVENLSAVTKSEILKIKEIGEKPLPDEVLAALSQKTEGVTFSPLYAVLQPKVAASFVEKLIYTPATKFLKSADVSPEWKEIIEKGIFAENIQETINTLKEAGLSETHPTIRKLEAKLQKVLSIQKNEKGQDRPGAKIFKHYYHFEEVTGKPLYDSKTKIFLSRKPIWSQGYSLRLREIFNKVGSAFRLYERIPFGPGKTVLRFSLPSKVIKFLSFGKFESLGGVQTWVFRQTIGKAVLALGKTAIGKAVKEGIKKAATFVATRLGIEAGVLAAGAAAAIPTAGVSLVIAAVIEIGIKAAKIIWNRFFKPIVSAIVRLVKEPEKALGAIIVGAAIVVLVPTAAVFGFALIGLGALGFLGSFGGILGGIGTGITSFFTALFTIPASTAPVTALVLGTLGGLSALTFFIVMTTAGAFILPVGPTEMIEEVPPPPAPPDIPPPPGLTFRWPVDNYSLCSYFGNFGYRILRGKCDYHEGIDIPAGWNEPVYATAKGEVYDAGNNPGYGNYVVVKHDGLFSFYAHLLSIAVFKGDNVDHSSVLGYVDDTGDSDGTHLHFGFSSCGDVPGCFNGKLAPAPDPCNYVSCPAGCEYRDRATGCPGL